MRKLKVTGGKLIIGEVQIGVCPMPSGSQELAFQYVLPRNGSWWVCKSQSEDLLQELTGTDYMTLMTIWKMFTMWKEMPKPLRRLTPFKTLLFPNAQVTY